MLAKSILARIDGALEASPCARCDKDHKTKHCPMNPGSGAGRLWRDMPKMSRGEADAYLKGLEGFVGGSASASASGNERPNRTGGQGGFGGPRPVGDSAVTSRDRGTGTNSQGRGAGQSVVPMHQAGTGRGTDAAGAGQGSYSRGGYAPRGSPAHRGGFAPRGGRSNNTASTRGGHGHQTYTQSNVPVQQYVEHQTDTGMYYPTAAAPIYPQPNGGGKPWRNTNSLKQLSKIPDPLYPLRQSFFTDRPDHQVILTNHFEYNLTTDKFYEYKILDFGTRNRRRIRQLFEDAVNDWPFLRDNKDYFATNYIDTIVAWKPLHAGLPQSEHDEWEKYIPTGKNITAANTTAKNDAQLVRFKYAGSFDAGQLRAYASADPSHVHVNFENIAKCLNIIISKSFDHRIHMLSSNKFFVKSARASLTYQNVASNQLELIRGYFYSVKPGMGNIILNFNICTSAVFRPIRVDEFLSNNNTFPPDKVESALRGKAVYLIFDRKDKDPEKQKKLNEERSRYWKVGAMQNGNIEDLTFMRPASPAKVKDDVPVMECVRVIDHLQAVFERMPISGRPAVNVGTGNQPIWYAQEHLRIVPYQPYTRAVPDQYTRSMVDQACRDPQASRALIESEGLSVMGFNVGDTPRGFGANIPVSLTPAMLQVPHQTLPFPITQYRSVNGLVTPRSGSRWKLPSTVNWHFVKTAAAGKKLRYAIILGPNINANDREVHDARLRREFGKLNMLPQNCIRIDFDDQLTSSTETDLQQKIKTLADMREKPDIVFLLLNRADKTIYRDFKNAADCIYPLQSICMTKKPPSKSPRQDEMEREIYTNIMMKINLKLGGINHRVQGVSERLKNTMVIGADLIHPGPGAFDGTPSIAAVVGSVDADGGRCLGSLRLQGIDKTDREIINAASLQEMVLDRLDAWRVQNGEFSLPENIIYYRDGVSSGHYLKVQTTELKAIREAYQSARNSIGLSEKKLNLAAVIVTKRHHTRFYPQNPDQGDRWGNKNTLPGTCVDQLVTSPYYQDFFLQSHSGIKGTARPTHYFVLHNEIPGLTLDKLRDLTHRLCYSYVRSMCAVSYASPTYYADRLCERGRLYIRSYYNGDNETHKAELDAAKSTKAKELREARVKEFGKSSVMSMAERMREKEHRDQSREFLRELTLSRVRAAFYCQPSNPDFKALPGARAWRNPYAYKLKDTMFWM